MPEKVVEVSIPASELRFWTPNGWVLDHTYNIYVGTDAKNAMTNCQNIEAVTA